MNKKVNDVLKESYEPDFITDAQIIKTINKGLSEQVVREISKYKNEPAWMLEFRLKALRSFYEIKKPHWGPDLSGIDFDDFTYFKTAIQKTSNTWDDVPENIKNTFERLGIPEAERKFLAGVSTQFESEVVYHSSTKELNELGVIFLDTETALKNHEDLFRKYFNKVISYQDNKYASLNSAVWSGGSFIYVPKDVKVEKPLQSYFRINADRMGQFERTLIIVDEGASVNYVEGCTAPIYKSDALHAAVVEIVVLEKGYCRYSTIQNWSNNVINLVTKRAHVYKDAHMEWIDGNIGSRINMKYPACYLLGENAKGTMVSIAVASANQVQDTGAKMHHFAKNTTSNIISKSIGRKGGIVNYRGTVLFNEKATNARSNIQCDTIILDELSKSDTIPLNVVKNSQSIIEHEASVAKISDDQLLYLMSRGLTKSEATELIVMGFIEPFSRELPMEYAVELNNLLKLEMEGSIG